MTVMGQKWRLFGKIKIFGAGHKIAVGHHFGLDFVVFFTHLVEVFSQLTGSPQGSTGIQKIVKLCHSSLPWTPFLHL